MSLRLQRQKGVIPGHKIGLSRIEPYIIIPPLKPIFLMKKLRIPHPLTDGRSEDIVGYIVRTLYGVIETYAGISIPGKVN